VNDRTLPVHPPPIGRIRGQEEPAALNRDQSYHSLLIPVNVGLPGSNRSNFLKLSGRESTREATNLQVKKIAIRI